MFCPDGFELSLFVIRYTHVLYVYNYNYNCLFYLCSNSDFIAIIRKYESTKVRKYFRTKVLKVTSPNGLGWWRWANGVKSGVITPLPSTHPSTEWAGRLYSQRKSNFLGDVLSICPYGKLKKPLTQSFPACSRCGRRRADAWAWLSLPLSRSSLREVQKVKFPGYDVQQLVKPGSDLYGVWSLCAQHLRS